MEFIIKEQILNVAKHHIDSYDAFLDTRLNVLLEAMCKKTDDTTYISHEICIPKKYQESSLEDLMKNRETYTCTIKIIYHKKITEKQQKGVKHKTVPTKTVQETKSIVTMPMMVNSKYCSFKKQNKLSSFDIGGYFIINGLEKILITKEDIAYNRLYEMKIEDNVHIFKYDSAKEIEVGKPQQLTLKWNYVDEKISLQIEFIQIENFPLFILFRALGVESDKDIITLILGPYSDMNEPLYRPLIGLLSNSMQEACFITTQEQAIRFMYNLTETKGYSLNFDEGKAVVYDILMYRLLRHVSEEDLSREHIVEQLFYEKAILLGHLTRQILLHILKIDRIPSMDSFELKRLTTPGVLIFNVFRDLMRKTDVDILRDNIITQELNKCFSGGKWGFTDIEIKEHDGIIQMYRSLSYADRISQLCKVRKYVNPSNKNHEIRRVHPTQWGILCPIHSDGSGVGIDKHLALGCVISIDLDHETYQKYLTLVTSKDHVHKIPRGNSTFIGQTLVFINDRLRYCTDDPIKYVNYLRQERVNNDYPSLSVFWNYARNEIWISFTAGRGRRVLQEIDSKKTVYIDTRELNNCRIGSTHQEIHGCLNFSVITLGCPYFNHSSASRISFHTTQFCQALSYPFTNYRKRMDESLGFIYYTQKPIIDTHVNEILTESSMCQGVNVMLCLSSWTGFNQEDAIIINRNALDRGLFMSLYSHTYTFFQDKENNDPREIIKTSSVEKNKIISKNSVLYAYFDSNREKREIKASKLLNDVLGYVEDIHEYEDDMKHVLRIKVRELRFPVIGDKLASRHSQKGLIGTIMDEIDLPFTQEGVYPDVLCNPHSFPKRMTVSQFIEMDKTFSILTELKENVPYQILPFSDVNVKDNTTSSSSSSMVTMYNGISGGKLLDRVNLSSVYYLRLKHMVDDKMHARRRGRKDPLTRQPVQGRSKEGGFRVGEMETWCLVSHGISHMLTHMFTSLSDEYYMPIDKETRLIKKNNFDYEYDTYVKVPYCYKLLMQELESIGISTKIITENDYQRFLCDRRPFPTSPEDGAFP
jgi:DNA-directed RNA polymerase beta subunit